MRLTRHRGTFNLEMSSEELNNVCLLLKGYTTIVKTLDNDIQVPSTLTEYLQELTVYQREAYAYDRYLEKEHQ